MIHSELLEVANSVMFSLASFFKSAFPSEDAKRR